MVFLLATIPAAISVAVILLYVREGDRPIPRCTTGLLRDTRRLGRELWTLTLIVLVFFMGEISYAFFLLRSEGLGSSTLTTILLYILFNVVFVVTSLPSGILSDRWGRRPVLASSFVLFALTCMAMGAAEGLPLLIVGFVLYGIYKGSSEGVFKAFVIDVVPKDLCGTALGMYHAAVGLVMLPGGVVAGLLWDVYGPGGTFAYGVATSLTSLVLMIFATRKADRGVRHDEGWLPESYDQEVEAELPTRSLGFL
jgi:MFS family permease